MVAGVVDRLARITGSDSMEPGHVGRMNLGSAAGRRSNDGRTHKTDVWAGLGAAAIAEKWMIGRAAMLADADQGSPAQNALRGAQIDAKI